MESFATLRRSAWGLISLFLGFRSCHLLYFSIASFSFLGLAVCTVARIFSHFNWSLVTSLFAWEA